MMETFFAVFFAVVLAKISELAFERWFRPSVEKQMNELERHVTEVRSKLDGGLQPPKPPGGAS